MIHHQVIIQSRSKKYVWKAVYLDNQRKRKTAEAALHKYSSLYEYNLEGEERLKMAPQVIRNIDTPNPLKKRRTDIKTRIDAGTDADAKERCKDFILGTYC
jgi:hypothetical protein